MTSLEVQIRHAEKEGNRFRQIELQEKLDILEAQFDDLNQAWTK